MSERLEKRLGDAKSIPEAMRMLALGKHYSPRVVKIIDCLISLKAIGPEHWPARGRYSRMLSAAIEAATPSELEAVAIFKTNSLNKNYDWKESNDKGWPELFTFALQEHAKIESGTRTQPISRDELKRFLLQCGRGYFHARHFDHQIKVLRSLGVQIVASKGRPSKLKRRTK
jgi:hypothetical protein